MRSCYKMTKKQKKIRNQILIAGGIFLIVVLLTHLVEMPVWLQLLLYLVPYFYIGWDVLWAAVRNIGNGQLFDEKFLMSIATIGSLALGEFPEAVFVMLFYKTGDLFEKVAVGKSRKSISALMDIRPDYANIEKDGELVQVSPDQVKVGDEIVVKPGEKVPLDGTVIDGSSALDTSKLTGESLPRNVAAGDSVISGCVNMGGMLRIKVSAPFGESTVSKILDLVENSSMNKGKTESFITRFAKYYTPIVVICALVLGLVTPIFAGDWSVWIGRALIFLVVSCPCALVISVPLTFFGGIGGASRNGILVKGANYLEMLSQTDIVVFDKTGTLTKGNFTVTAIHPEKISEAQLLEYAALAEHYSDHPISFSLKQAYGKDGDPARVAGVEEIAGHGVVATIDGKRIAVGNRKLMSKEGAHAHDCHLIGTAVHVAVDGVYAGHIIIADQPKEDAAKAISELKAHGAKVVMLTGDSKAVAADIASRLGITDFYAELLPADKVTMVEKLLAEKAPGEKLAFVGDGINDAPVLSRADIGIAMGALGSDAAIEAADVVLMDDKPSKISRAVQISKRTKRIVKENIIFALSVKFLIMIFAVFGLADMWLASFGDVGVSVIAILNATRALRVK